MTRESAGPILTTVFVDYDNIYLSLKRKNEDAAKRFAKDSGSWLQAILAGALVTPTSTLPAPSARRLVMSRCYGNPSPRRNAHDNSTDMNSFPFVRHHFLRAGFEAIDCSPMTGQLKNAADIRIVMEISDLMHHKTYFDEFIVMSGDADFTPLIHRLRSHARRTVVYANEQTARPYTALSDGEIREADLVDLLLEGRAINLQTQDRSLALTAAPALPKVDIEAARKAILAEVIGFVRNSAQAVPLEKLADRAVRIVGRDQTVDTDWAGHGTFRDLLLANLPDELHLSDTPPYTVFDATKHITSAGLLSEPEETPLPAIEARPTQERSSVLEPAIRETAAATAAAATLRATAPAAAAPANPRTSSPVAQPSYPMQPAATAAPRAPAAPAPRAEHAADVRPQQHAQPPQPQQQQPRPPQQQSAPAATAAPRSAEQATHIQQSITRIHNACQAPALAPAEYRVLFDVMASEIAANGLQGSQTIANLTQRAREFGLDLKRDDLRFILEAISESDPWFEQGVSANLFASRFRNYVVACCRSKGLSLSAEELDLIEAWFSAQPPEARQAPVRPQAPETRKPAPPTEKWWSLDDGRQAQTAARADGTYGQGPSLADDEFPRIIRSRFKP